MNKRPKQSIQSLFSFTLLFLPSRPFHVLFLFPLKLIASFSFFYSHSILHSQSYHARLVIAVVHKHQSANTIGYFSHLGSCIATPESHKASSQDGAVKVRFSKDPLTSVSDPLELGSMYIMSLAREATFNIWGVTSSSL